ncbi:transcriptional regulator with XRE-family HTH domain [Deinococcus metalli]|uniref:Transcriptional regulator with XRE-family HTH domain n=1 Tax=Deinococcus metalli TaxID=1141878 RepID=A0A7W8KFV5_9DEIO|nr:helix-turn-helix domain-containing protein [Deinococcus metalli]MBB5377439.1 transcriptional regulator with XRE-family HTH domain [Deinococcus metalli]
MTSSELGLGATLRAWRDRLNPAGAGLPVTQRRRTAGLRREELAELAGISVDYLVRLEQGRAATPSAGAVAALARALRLDAAERDHLYQLAGLQPPAPAVIEDAVPPGVQRLVTRLGDVAVAVFTADWRLVWWTPTWAALLGDPAGVPPEERSLVRARFPVPGQAGRVEAWPVQSSSLEASNRAIVADLRRASVRYPTDTRLADLLQRLIAGNATFAALWRGGAVGQHTEDCKTVEHPVVGDIHVDCDVLSTGDSDFKIVALTSPPGSEDARRIDRARQRLAADVTAV